MARRRSASLGLPRNAGTLVLTVVVLALGMAVLRSGGWGAVALAALLGAALALAVGRRPRRRSRRRTSRRRSY